MLKEVSLRAKIKKWRQPREGSNDKQKDIYSDFYGQLSALHSSQLPGTICPTTDCMKDIFLCVYSRL